MDGIMSETETPKGTIWYPNQRVLRTIATRIVAGVPTLVAIIGIVAAAWPYEWLIATSALSVLVQTTLTKIITLPAVDAWLKAHTPIGSAPRA